MSWATLVVTAACMGYSVGTSRRIEDMPSGLIAWGAVMLGAVTTLNVGMQAHSWIAAAVAAVIWLGLFVAVYRPARDGKLIPYNHD